MHALTYWNKNVIQLEWFKACYPITPPALIAKEYSPGRFRYFNLPTNPFMTVECNQNDYLKLSLKEFTYAWSTVFGKVIHNDIKHFSLEVRHFHDKTHVEVEFSKPEATVISKETFGSKKHDVIVPTGHIYVISVKQKHVFKYSFTELKMKLQFDELSNNFYKSFNDFIQVHEIYEINVKGLEIQECDGQLEKDLLDYWNYNSETKTDLLFIDSQHRKQATLVNKFGTCNLYLWIHYN